MGVEHVIVIAAEKNESRILPPGSPLERREGDEETSAVDFAVAGHGRSAKEKQLRHPTVSHLVALAATRVGDVALAEKCLAETIAKRERVSDAMALQAVLESMKQPAQMMGDSKVKAENHLRQAILADPANAAPRFELSTLLRYSTAATRPGRKSARHKPG